MKVVRTVRSGQPGTKDLVAKYGNRLIVIRYRKYAGSNELIRTVELRA